MPEFTMDFPDNVGQPQPETQKTSKSVFWKAGCALLAIVAALSLAALVIVGIVFGLAALAGSALPELQSLGSLSSARTFTEELVSGSHFASDKILVIDVVGVISSSPGSIYEVANAKDICDQLKSAEEDSSVKAVIINLDTPGGEVTASDDIHHQILKLRAKPSGRPVVAMMNSLAASGGYYVAVACDSIVANKLTLTGSIGVIIEGYNYAELFNKIGLKSEIYKSGPMKDMLDGSRPRTEEERVVVQRLVDNTYEEFLNVVSAGRKIPKAQLKGAAITDGRVLDGRQAFTAGLVDKLGYFDDAVKEAASLSKSSNYKVIRYTEAFNLARLLEKVSAKDARAVKLEIGGVSAQVPPLRKGCLYFLPTTW
jgi:protease IV